MGSRDFAGREKKKVKKDAKKHPAVSTNIEATHPEVEIIRKGKKPKDIEEE